VGRGDEAVQLGYEDALAGAVTDDRQVDDVDDAVALAAALDDGDGARKPWIDPEDDWHAGPPGADTSGLALAEQSTGAEPELPAVHWYFAVPPRPFDHVLK
jgi:hypothetical protein